VIRNLDPCRILTFACFWFVLTAAPALAGGDADPTPEEQIIGLEQMCSESTDARAARHTETPLYERLGGEEKIEELVREIVRLHDENPVFDRFMDEIDQEVLVHGVAKFMVTGTGGPGSYEGRSMPEAHGHLKLTNSDFMAAGGDVVQAMKNLGYGEEEIQEIVCVLVGFRAAVVVDEDKVIQ
jgi:hemoglobin